LAIDTRLSLIARLRIDSLALLRARAAVAALPLIQLRL